MSLPLIILGLPHPRGTFKFVQVEIENECRLLAFGSAEEQHQDILRSALAARNMIPSTYGMGQLNPSNYDRTPGVDLQTARWYDLQGAGKVTIGDDTLHFFDRSEGFNCSPNSTWLPGIQEALPRLITFAEPPKPDRFGRKPSSW